MERLVFVGPGRLGLALGYALSEADAVGSLLYLGRAPEPPDHPLFHQGTAEYRFGIHRPEPGTTAVLLTVPDDALPEVVQLLASAGEAPAGCPVLHTSGALGSELLAPLHARGYRVGTLHPLQSVANPIAGAERLRGATFALSGEREALAAARRLVQALEGRSLVVPPAARPLYHAAAVLVSNYLVLMLGEGTRLFQRAGVSPGDAVEALAGLARGTIENVEALGVDRALTGPVVREDADTVGLHLRSLEPEDARLYAFLGQRTLDMVRDRLAPEAAVKLEDLFRRYR